MKTLIFKIGHFPQISETFILNQIITAIHCGFDVKILVKNVLSFERSKQSELLNKYAIADKIVIEDYEIPKRRAFRIFKWCFLLLTNLKDLKYIFQFYKYQKSFSLTWLFQLLFYKKFSNASIFHIQYGTNKGPVDILKYIGFLKAKLIVSFHGHDAFFPINGFIPNNGYYKYLFAAADIITVNTPYLFKQVHNLKCPTNILKTIPIGIDTSYFKPKKYCKRLSKRLKLITVGRLEIVKGHLYALKVVLILKNRGYNVHLSVVGEGKERQNIESFLQENDLINEVTLEGAKSQSEIRDLLLESDIFIFTSVATVDGRRETQGLATIEAQACGLPVVVFDSGGVKYTLENNETGFIVPEYDVESMVDKIEYLNSNLDSLKLMGSNAVEFVDKNYSNDVINENWRTIYNN